jgi:septum formation protein
MPDLVLASASPRRKSLLAAAGYQFSIVSPVVEEGHDPALSCVEQTVANARLKALEGLRMRPGSLVIGADTLVYLDDQPLGKPSDLTEARAMLTALSGRTHHVCTGVALASEERVQTFATLTAVTFKTLTPSLIDHYLSAVHVLDKAGAYAVQEQGDWIVASVEGSRSNVVGLPMEDLGTALTKLGVQPTQPAAAPDPRLTLVFDIGNVLVRFDFSRAASALSAHTPLSMTHFLERLDGIKDDFEGGLTSEDEFFTTAMQRCQFTGSREVFERAWCDIFEINKPMLATLERLSALPQPPRMVLLSNTNEPHRRWLFQQFPQVFRHFDGGIYSHTARSMKPQDEIFRQLVSEYALETERAFYIDDLEKNIAAGRSWGLHTWTYDLTEHPAFQQALDRWLAQTH